MGVATRERVPVGVDRDEALLVEQVLCPPGNLSYVVASLPSRSAAIVDPEPAAAQRYRAIIARGDLRVRMVVDTHTHVDHISIARHLAAEHGCPWVMHESAQTPFVTRRVHDGEELELGHHRARFWHCPGHTRDMIVLLVGSRVLTGDTLFIGSCGRSDLPGGNHRDQWASLRRLMSLPDDTLVYPGHDYNAATHTTIGAERTGNPRLALDEEAFVQDALTRLDLAFPERFEEAIRANTR
jgi:glyoxylase-like metal-dependent hydrolase (beta-lactamase superfamily II)